MLQCIICFLLLITLVWGGGKWRALLKQTPITRKICGGIKRDSTGKLEISKEKTVMQLVVVEGWISMGMVGEWLGRGWGLGAGVRWGLDVLTMVTGTL